MTNSPITRDQVGCARCDGDGHLGITFLPLTFPVELSSEPPFTHWASCPTNGEPILMRHVELQQLARGIDGKECPYTQEELNRMIVVLEDTGRYDVGGRRW